MSIQHAAIAAVLSGLCATSATLAHAPGAAGAAAPSPTPVVYLPLIARVGLTRGTPPPATVGGRIGAIAAADGLVYGLLGQRLAALDPASPGDGWLVGESGPLAVPVTEVVARNGLVFGAVPSGYSSQDPMHGSPSGLATFDVRDPRHPRIASFLRGPTCVDIAVAPPTAWLACGILWGVDVATPAAPRETARVPTQDTGSIGAVDWDGRHLFTLGLFEAQGLGVVQAMAVGESSTPRTLGRTTFATTARSSLSRETDHLARREHWLYAASRRAGTLHIVDVGLPEQPRVVGTVDAGGDVAELEVVGDHLVAAVYPYRPDGAADWNHPVLRVWSLGRPDQPRLTGTLDLPGSFSDLAAQGADALVATGPDLLRVPLGDGGGLRALPASPRDRVVGPSELALADGRLFVRDGGRVLIYDVFNPTRPVELARYEAAPGAIAATRDRLYLARGDEGVYIVAVADPAAPARVGWVPAESPLRDLAVDGSTLFLAEMPAEDRDPPPLGALRIVDVADPARPVVLARIAGMPTVVAAAGGRMAVARNGGTGSIIDLYDVSDLAAPRLLGTSDPIPSDAPDGSPTVVGRLALSGSLVFADDWRLDFSQPEAPVLVRREPSHFCFFCRGRALIAVQADTVAVALANYVGTHAITAPATADPYVPFRYRLPERSGAVDLATDGRGIYMATTLGLWTIGVTPSPDEAIPIPNTRLASAIAATQGAPGPDPR